jgi:hypothetical protein
MRKNYIVSFLLMMCFEAIWAQCPADILITGAYSTAYTNSHTWIASNGSTTIAAGADVTLDANPLTNGYVFLDVGFETQPNSVFLAVVQTPCSLLGISQNEALSEFVLYPNPVSNELHLKGHELILKAEIFDINGKLIFTHSEPTNQQTINTSMFSKGLYMLKITTEKGFEIHKFLKE